MPDRNKPFWNRPNLAFSYPGIQQVGNTCVFASNAGAVNHLAGRPVWTLSLLIDECEKQGVLEGGPGVGGVAHSPVTGEIGYLFNDKSKTDLANHTVRHWVEQENKVVILSRSYRHNPALFHMLTLVAWDTDHYVAWDTNGRMSILYENEIEQDIPYQNGTVLTPHANHDAFVYWSI